MRYPFYDITLYIPSKYQIDSQEYAEDKYLQNFVSDFYVQKMKGYKPPKTTRITIQPAYHEIWGQTWKNGSVVACAPYFNFDEYAPLNKIGKYKYILDLIQSATLQLSNEYGWNKSIFQTAYDEVLKSNFNFKVEYPFKSSRDKKKIANLFIEKTETITSLYTTIKMEDSTITKKLLDKKNAWWYDCIYILCRHAKWFDSNKFGIDYKKINIQIFFSIQENAVTILEEGKQVDNIDFSKYFLFG